MTITSDEILSKILIWGVLDSGIFGGALVIEEFGVASQMIKFEGILNKSGKRENWFDRVFRV